MSKSNPLILMILDVSSSMRSVIPSMNASFKQIIEDQSTERGDSDLSVFTFASDIKHDIAPVSFKTKPTLTLSPRGYTALYDTVVEALDSVPNHYKDVLVLIQTDGQDNKSSFSYSDVKRKVTEKRAQGWQFLYMGAEIDVSVEADKIGLKDCAVKFKRDSKGIEQVFNEMSRKVSNYRASLDTVILKPKLK
jgi:uncharacterized protein YegL